MTTLEEIRYAYVWQSCTGVESRAKEFDGWLNSIKALAWQDGIDDGNLGMYRNDNPYRESLWID